jgi:hypothetical protein
MEDVDDFYADIEVAANQNFEDFHNALVELADLKGKEMASFYFCDALWRRLKEISLVDLSDPDQEDVPKTAIMKESVLAKCIEDPHQKIMYIYDFMRMITFYIELKKISEAQKGVKYPRVIKKCGELPKSGIPLPPKVSLGFDEEGIEVFDETENTISEDETNPFDEFGEEFSAESAPNSNEEF